jgi:hypothetical protein
LGEVFGVGVGDDAPGLVAQRELGVAEEGLVGGRDELACHREDGVGGSSLDPGGQLLGLGFEFGTERLGHDDLLPG